MPAMRMAGVVMSMRVTVAVIMRVVVCVIVRLVVRMVVGTMLISGWRDDGTSRT